MYPSAIDLQVLFHLNDVLKEHGYETTIHTLDGCTFNGIQFIDLDENNLEAILEIANDFLKDRFMRIEATNEENTEFKLMSILE